MTESHKLLIAQLKDIVTAIDDRRPFDHTSAANLVLDGLREAAASGEPKIAMPVLASFGKTGEVPALLSALLREGAADAFVAVLRRTEADDGCIHNSMSVMALLCSDLEFRKAITAAGAARSIAAVLQRRGAFVLTVTSACHAVRIIAGNRDVRRDCDPSCRAALMEAGAPEALLKALVERKGDLDRVVDLAGAMWAVADIPGALTALGRAGAVPALIAVLQLHTRSATVARPACLVLSELIADDGFRREMHARNFAGIAAVIDVVRLQAGDAKIVRAACAPLSRAGTDAAALPLLARRAAPLLVAAMRRHSGDAEMVSDALATLNNCCNDKALCVVLFQAGVLSAASAAVRHHRTDGQLADRACAVLCSFLTSWESFAELRDQLQRDSFSIGKEMIRALHMHASRPLLAMFATTALAIILSKAGGDQAAELLAVGAAQALTAALRQFPCNENVVEMACFGLDKLMDKAATPGSPPEAIPSKILAAEVTEPVAAGLRAALARSGDAAERAAGMACCLLARVAHLESEAALLARFGSAADVTAALSRFKAQDHVRAAASFVLRCIAELPVARAALAPVHGKAVAAVVEVLRTHESVGKVVVQCVDILSQVGFTGAPTGITDSCEGAATLVRALDHHKADAAVVAAVGMAVQNLCAGNATNAKAFLKEVRVNNDHAACSDSDSLFHDSDARCHGCTGTGSRSGPCCRWSQGRFQPVSNCRTALQPPASYAVMLLTSLPVHSPSPFCECFIQLPLFLCRASCRLSYLPLQPTKPTSGVLRLLVASSAALQLPATASHALILQVAVPVRWSPRHCAGTAERRALQLQHAMRSRSWLHRVPAEPLSRVQAPFTPP